MNSNLGTLCDMSLHIVLVARDTGVVSAHFFDDDLGVKGDNIV